MQENNEASDSRDENRHILDSTIRRFEEMKRKRERYFFDVDALLRIIEHYIETVDYQKATEIIRYAQSLHPHSVQFRLKDAHIMALTNKEEEALKVLDEVERVSPFDVEVYIIRGNILNMLEQFDKAVVCFKKALHVAEDQKDDLYLSLGITYQNMMQYGKAVDNFKLCLLENPDNEVALEEMVHSVELSDRGEEGINFYNKLIDDRPYSFITWFHLGNLYARLSFYEKAIQAYDYCLLIKEDYSPAILDMAHVYTQLEQYELAIDRYKIAFEYCKPDAFTYYNIGECYEQLEQYGESRAYYKRCVKMVPEFAQAWYGIGVTLEAEDRWYEAIHYIKKAIDIDNQHGDYWFALGDCEYKLCNYEAADDCYRKVIDYDPENVEGFVTYAEFLFEQNRIMEAAETINAAIAYHPNDSELYYRHVCYLYAGGYQQEAIIKLDEALELDFTQHSLLFEIVPEMENDPLIINRISPKK